LGDNCKSRRQDIESHFEIRYELPSSYGRFQSAQKNRDLPCLFYTNERLLRHAGHALTMHRTRGLARTAHLRLGIPEWFIARYRETKLPQVDYML
jgi:hypothetical protein